MYTERQKRPSKGAFILALLGIGRRRRTSLRELKQCQLLSADVGRCTPTLVWMHLYDRFDNAKNNIKQRNLNTVFANISNTTLPTSDSFLLIMSHVAYTARTSSCASWCDGRLAGGGSGVEPHGDLAHTNPMTLYTKPACVAARAAIWFVPMFTWWR